MRQSESGRRQVVRLPDPIPVHVLYWTAFVDADGKINLLPDIYRRDKALSEALEESPPKP